ncbi:MAG: STAS domain-containing protein [Candidatus Omnitrophota bacterium]
MALDIQVQKKDKGVYIVSLAGNLDSATFQELEQKLKPILITSTKALMLNLEKLTYISSMGVSVILKAKKAMEEQKSDFAMMNLQPQIKRVFEIINALPSVRVFENMEEADAYLDEMQRRVLEERNKKDTKN